MKAETVGQTVSDSSPDCLNKQGEDFGQNLSHVSYLLAFTTMISSAEMYSNWGN